MESGSVPLGKFIITKQLTKRPEDYPDAKGQPHVMVAARRKAAGKRDGVGAVGVVWGGCVDDEVWDSREARAGWGYEAASRKEVTNASRASHP